MKINKIFSGLMLALALIMASQTSKTYAYTIEDMSDYIENPEWFDNQDGGELVALEDNMPVGTSEPVVSNTSIYLGKKTTSYQIYVRQYDAKNGIDIDESGFTWTSCDERICTVDNGLVKAGSMTGVTVLVAENKDYVIGFTVVNQTGNEEQWYEDMFTDIYDGNKWGFQGPLSISKFDGALNARKSINELGEAYKIVVDAYLSYGEQLNTDTSVRKSVLQDAISKAVAAGHAVLKSGTKIWGDCQSDAFYTERITRLFVDDNRSQKCASGTDGPVDHVTNYLLLGGIIYNINNTQWAELCPESDGEWKKTADGNMELHFDDDMRNLKDVAVYPTTRDSFRESRNCIEAAMSY